ncbi:hypothetical protein WJ0W_002577 [Paenibacillus melissococcoides]|uniref:Uncharacterized protein n=1 Tax=Paenibacillus melissococcoides TaxID=2912268 RepID=A0ABM9G164_9BACL|nr:MULTISPECIES: hypothetical protein [Paenibacillus]MEB9892088.1 hypothetical protein [Bacillus cereus]CAH8245342.1 hypothetical protein WJ0W_002577 [Paenibacillus melissococcoides]CAH8710687.1 hypothetical protein WDD9_002657 [Paenibacillus melissococcoides]CAH8711459.1 hypothetical protein HTL2_002958 [Paenibacillus melissococcoides]
MAPSGSEATIQTVPRSPADTADERSQRPADYGPVVTSTGPCSRTAICGFERIGLLHAVALPLAAQLNRSGSFPSHLFSIPIIALSRIAAVRRIRCAFSNDSRALVDARG